MRLRGKANEARALMTSLDRRARAPFSLAAFLKPNIDAAAYTADIPFCEPTHLPTLFLGCDGPGLSAVRAIAVEGLYLELHPGALPLDAFVVVATLSLRQVVFITSALVATTQR